MNVVKAEAKLKLSRTSPQHSQVTKLTGMPWGVEKIKAPQAWSQTTGRQIRIGVIDTGIDFNHPALRHSLIPGINLVDKGQPPIDDNGHGTHIAGIIAASSPSLGMIGVAPHALIAPVKAFDYQGSAYVSDIVQAIDWCVQNKMHIINMSFGMRTKSKAMYNSVLRAYSKGVVIIASSGNDRRFKSVDYPAKYPHTISVGATNALRKIAPFSNRGSYIDIYAPGDKIVSSWSGNEFHEMSGTSMATSHVTGAVALLLEKYPNCTPSEIKAILKRSMNTLRQSKKSRTGELDVIKMLQVAKELLN